jgi:homoserine/homoserine lactone efflux protein
MQQLTYRNRFRIVARAISFRKETMLLARWLSFLLAAILISISPGPGAFASMASGAAYGWRRGYWTAIGLQCGMLFLLAVTGLGLGALLAVSPVAFTVIKFVGAAYLAYLGVKLWLARPQVETEQRVEIKAKTRGQFVLEGFLVDATNPKGAIFMLAVLPAFIDLDRPKGPQYAAIAGTMVAVDAIVMAIYTALGAQLLRAMKDPANQRWLNRGFGTVLLAAGIWVAVRK